MAEYTIIDEPGVSKFDNLIMNPTLIVFISIFLPIAVRIPWGGNLWIPPLWIVVNGWLIGSATMKKETGLCFAALACIATFFYLIPAGFVVSGKTELLKTAIPYIRIMAQGSMWFFIFYAANLQTVSYNIYEYIRKAPDEC